jgi:hypothetical protein
MKFLIEQIIELLQQANTLTENMQRQLSCLVPRKAAS